MSYTVWLLNNARTSILSLLLENVLKCDYRPRYFKMSCFGGKSKNQQHHTQGCCHLDVAKISVRNNESLCVISQEEGTVQWLMSCHK